MNDVFLLSKAQMARIAPYFPLSHGIPRVDDRRVVSGIVYVIRNGLQWKECRRPLDPTRPSTTASSAGLNSASLTASSPTWQAKGNSNQLTLRERRIGFVFQQYALFKHMTVMDNIAFGLRARPRASRPAKTAIQTCVLELLSLVQLDGLEARFPAQLSGGQR